MADRHQRELLSARVATALRLAFVAIGILSIVLGYVGMGTYIRQQGQSGSVAHSPGDLVYYDLELFLVQPIQAISKGPLPWQLAVARFTAPCVSAAAIIEFGVAVFAERIRRARVRRSRGHAIVCGSTRFAEVLAGELRRGRTRVVTIGRNSGDPSAADYVIGDPTVPKTLRDAGVERAAAVYACLEDSARNVQIANTVEHMTPRGPAAQRIHALVTDPDLCLALKARRWSRARGDHQRVEFFNLEELASQRVVRLDQAVFDEEAPRVAVVGTGAFARSVLVESARQWSLRRKRAGTPLTATLVGADAARVIEALRVRFPFLDDVCVLLPRNDALDDLLADHALPRAPELHRLYLCQEDEGEALKSALALTAHSHSAVGRIVVRLDRMAGVVGGFVDGFSVGVDAAGGAGAIPDARGGGRAIPPGRPGGEAMLDALDGRLLVVDVAAEACGPAARGDDLAESLARAVHQRYLFERLAAGAVPGSSPAMTPWEDLGEDVRVANRAQALDIGGKMASIGCLLVPRSVRDREFAYRDGEVETLARREHGRWSAERLRSGWRYAPARDDSRRLNPSLRAWDDLPEDIKELNCETVRALPELLAESGLAVLRLGGTDGERLTTTVPPPRAR